MSLHAKDRWKTRASEREEDEHIESAKDAGLIADTTHHRYLRDDKYVHVMLKMNEEKELAKTVLEWQRFQKDMQKTIERYN